MHTLPSVQLTIFDLSQGCLYVQEDLCSYLRGPKPKESQQERLAVLKEDEEVMYCSNYVRMAAWYSLSKLLAVQFIMTPLLCLNTLWVGGKGGEFYTVYRCWYPTRCVADYCETCTVIKTGQTLATMVLLLFSVNITHFIDMQ